MLNRLRRVLFTILCVLCAVHFLRFWILPGRDGLWIDEAGTYWTIAAGWEQLWERTAISPHSRLYGALLLPWTRIAGTSEAALRLPSMLAALAAAAMLAALVRRKLGEDASWLPAVFLLASPEISFFALDARPYGFALLLVMVSLTACASLQRAITFRAAAIWALSAALLVNLQPLVSAALGGQVVWLLWGATRRGWTLLAAAAYAGMFGAAALGAAPEVFRLRRLIRPGDPSAFAGGIDLANVLKGASPASILVPAVLAALALLAMRAWKRAGWDEGARQLAALGAFIVCATVSLLAVYSYGRRIDLMLPRYLIAIYPAYLLILCAVLARHTHSDGRLWFGAVYSAATLGASLYGQGWIPRHSDADWRGAMATVRQWEGGRPTPLLLETGFVEGMRQRTLNDPRRQAFLYAPALYYPHAGPTFVLPFRAGSRPILDIGEVVDRAGGTPFAAIVYATAEQPSPYIPLIAAKRGRPRLLGRFLRLEVYSFGEP